MPLFKFLKRGKEDKTVAVQEKTDYGLHSTQGKYGLKTLAEPKNAMIDIVFVHGLTGDRETTWTHKNKTFWPQDLLPRRLPNARIITFGYDANLTGAFAKSGSKTLREHGESLAKDLASTRVASKTNQRPLLFVAHGLGGLIVEQALLISRGSPDLYVKDILNNTEGIVFMGTPHAGSELADWGDVLTRTSKAFRITNQPIVDVLRPASEMLAYVQQEFHTLLASRQRKEGKYMEIFCFYEELDSGVMGKIVPEHSAVLAAYPNASIHGDHTSMTKFENEKDNGFKRVSDRLCLWAEAIKERQVQHAIPTTQHTPQAVKV